MARPLVVVGAGGFGRETVDVARAVNRVADQEIWDVRGVLDDDPGADNLRRLERLGLGWLGPVEVAGDLPVDIMVSVGVGSPQARRRLVSTALGLPEDRFATLVHPTAVLGSEVSVGAGSVVCAGVSVGTNATLGRSVHLNPHAVIGHDTVLEDFVSVNPNATVSGACLVGEAVLVGAAAVVLQGRRVGTDSVVGAAACVVRDVEPGATVKGVPAR